MLVCGDTSAEYDFSLFIFLDRINRINWIFSFGRSPEESDQTPIASGEGEHTLKFIGN
jgi:hypothetical protein